MDENFLHETQNLVVLAEHSSIIIVRCCLSFKHKMSIIDDVIVTKCLSFIISHNPKHRKQCWSGFSPRQITTFQL